MKKLISIGVVVALLALVVLPGVVGADGPSYTPPVTYATIPFAIIQSGFTLVGALIDDVGSVLGLPSWLNSTLLDTVGGWAGGPLTWSVSMVAWGLDLVGEVLGGIQPILTGMKVSLPFNLTDLQSVVNIVVCKLQMAYSNATSNATLPACS
ncbi:MAG TPA: hypothetical protein VEG28_01490 [Dehalococcoidia bacterium]|nr:hypothetical protein [Dehalococcoidia bacterium]